MKKAYLDSLDLLSCFTWGGKCDIDTTGHTSSSPLLLHIFRSFIFQFISLLILLLTLEGLVCALCILYQPSISTSLKTILHQRVIQDYGREGYEEFTASLSYTQYKFSCCGIVSPSDYQNSVINTWRWTSHNPFLQARLEVPRTCCKLLNKGVGFHDHNSCSPLLLNQMEQVGSFFT